AHIPLSFAQQQIWIIDQLEGSRHYHMPSRFRLEGQIDATILETALRDIVDRHEVLRTVFRTNEDQVYQLVLSAHQWQLSYEDLSQEKQTTRFQKLLQAYINAPFDLANDYCLRALLVKTAEAEHQLIFVIHHIAGDGWSSPIFLHELQQTFAARLNGQSPQLAKLPIQYADYAIWQNQVFGEQRLAKALAYWENKLRGLESLEWPLDFPRPANKSQRGKMLHFKIGTPTSTRIRQLARKEGLTTFMILLATLKVLCYRYTAQEDICIGSPTANRNHQATAPLMGYFLNILALRSDLSGQPDFKTLLQQIRRNTLEAYRHEWAPFNKVVDRVVKGRDQSRSPLFQTMFVLQNELTALPRQLGEAQLIEEDIEYDIAKFDLTFLANETPEGIEFTVEFCTDLFLESTVQRMIQHFQQLLQSALDHPEAKISQLKMLTPTEKQNLLPSQDLAIAPLLEGSIIPLFEEQVEESPEYVALQFGEKQYTYQSLNQWSNQLAHHLIETFDIQFDDLIAVQLPHGDHLVKAILAILKSGAAYVPIDPNYPEQRKAYILQESQAKVLIDESFIDQFKAIRSKCNVSNPALKHRSSQLAYVIFTSGSTGRPKGVMIEQASLLNYLHYCQKTYGKGLEAFHFPLFTSISFDLTQTSLFLPLLSGGCLFVYDPNDLEESISQIVNNPQINAIKLTPSHTYFLDQVEVNTNIQLAIVGGERLEKQHIEFLQQLQPQIRIFNEYGPTEATIGCIVYEIQSADEAILIGQAIDQTEVYILDQNQALVPDGVRGEICIGGAGLARAYFKQPALTKEKFIPHPFSSDPTARLYRTGDWACRKADGNIQYFGRIDEQVKIRGHRIELAEIELALQKLAGIQSGAVVVHKDEHGNDRLIAYIVTHQAWTPSAVKDALQLQLPTYMIPQMIIEVDRIPMSPNGKTDRKALPQPDLSSVDSDNYTAPRNPVEKELSKIWQDLLSAKNIGIHDNFFELGGDSIITIQVVNRARRKGYALKAKDLFEYQSIAQLAQKAQQETQSDGQTEQGGLSGAAPLLPIQQWFFDQQEDLSHYNQALLLQVDKTIHVDHLTTAVEALVQRHDALRFAYQRQDNVWTQRYTPNKAILQQEDLRQVSATTIGEQIKQISQQHQEGLDLRKGPLYRFVWMQMPETEDKHRLLMVIHHLAVDVISWRVLTQDLNTCLQQLAKGQSIELGQKGSSYRQWSAAMQRWGLSAAVQSQSAYWKRTAQQKQVLPTDKKQKDKVALRVADSIRETVYLNKKQSTALLRKVHHAYQTNINDLLLAALAQSIQQWSGQNKITIGLEGHGREALFEQLDISQTMGWFTNLYPQLIQLETQLDLGQTIKSVKEQIRAVPNKGMAYGLLRYQDQDAEVRQSLAKGDAEIIFNYLGQMDSLIDPAAQLQIAKEALGSSVSPKTKISTKLEINAYLTQGRLAFEWTYAPKQYYKKTIRQLSRQCLKALEQIIQHCQEQIHTEWTPIDFGLAPDVSALALDQFITRQEQKLGTSINPDTLYRLSSTQEGILFHQLYDPKSTAYIEQLSLECSGPFEVNAFEQAWQSVMEQYPVLRTQFLVNELKVPVQIVVPQMDLPLEVMDLSTLTSGQQQSQVEAIASAEVAKGFHFSQAPLMRVSLLLLGENRFQFIWTHHHILLDGWSLPIILKTLFDCYQAILKQQSLAAAPQDHYANYIHFLQSIDPFVEQAFWKNYLADFESPSLLPFVAPQSNRNQASQHFGLDQLALDTHTTNDIKQFAQKHHLTVNTIMQGVWGILLSRYSNQSDCLYGVTVAGRPAHLEGVDQRVGLYINTLPIRIQVEDTQQIVDYLSKIQKNHSQARVHEYASMVDIQNWSGIPGDLFDSILVFENYPLGDLFAEDQAIQITDIQTREKSNFLLTIAVNMGANLDIGFSFNRDLLDPEYVQLIKGHFKTVLQQIIQPTTITLDDIDLLTQQERRQILETFNPPLTGLSDIQTVDQQFEVWVEQQPEAIALAFGAQEWTYRELNERANQLAAYLKEHHQVQKGDFVGILLERSEWMIIAIWGIIKAEAAYVPINLDYPLERKQFIVKDAQMKVLITSTSAQDHQDLSVSQCIVHPNLLDQSPSQQQARVTRPNAPVYLLYTSGTTGQPKGTLINHTGLLNMAQSTEALRFQPSDRVLQWSNLSFDASVYDIFNAYLNGASLYLIEEADVADPERIKSIILRHQINAGIFSTAFFNAFVEHDVEVLGQYRKLLFGGEAASAYHVKKAVRAMGPDKLVNAYGPTESTVYGTYYPVQNDDFESLPIGYPINGAQIYIVDNKERLVGVGQIGEIWIGGKGVANGYLNRSELTGEKFISDPFHPGANQRIYKTGDLARWQSNGTIEFMGRKDSQVKIRGFRVELSAIEKTLQQIAEVQEALVVTQKDQQGTLQIIAYLIGGQQLAVDAVKAQIKSQLPDFMVPASFVQLEQFPITSNGKIDRKALPQPNFTDLARREYVAPQNEVEQQLTEIWLRLLDLSEIGTQDGFFAMGGHSLTATRLASAIHHTFQVDIAVNDLFTHTTIQAQALLIETEKKVERPTFSTVEKRPKYIPLSFAQERLWFIHQLKGSVEYHLSTVLTSDVALDQIALEKAFQALLERHEVLRTVIVSTDEQVYQEVKTEKEWQIDRFDPIPQEQDLAEFCHDYVNQAFDLTEDFPIRVALFQSSTGQHCLLPVLHHIASDGWSVSIFIKELMNFYQGFINNPKVSLPALQVQYADYAIWQREHFDPRQKQAQVAYWTQKLADLQTVELSNDYPRPSVQSTRGAQCQIRLSATLSQQLQSLAQRQEVSGFMLMMTALNILLFKYTRQEDICIGTPIAGRNDQALEPLIGFFINMLAIRNQVHPQAPFTALLQKVKATSLDAFAHQELPFEQIVEAIDWPRDQSRTPIFQISLTYDNTPEIAPFQIGHFQVNQALTDQLSAKAQRDLSFFINQDEEGFNIRLLYCSDLYRPDSMEQLLVHFQQLLVNIVQKPDQQIAQLTLVDQAEQRQLLFGFNDNYIDYPADQSVITTFEQQVQKYPTKSALVNNRRVLTYEELNEKANQLAQQLVEQQQIQGGHFVGLLLDRSEWMIIAMLGVLKTGAAYVPIHPEYPLERKQFMLEDAGIKTLILHSDHLFDYTDLNVALFPIDIQLVSETGPVQPFQTIQPINAQDAAYLMYTS
ncbi:MAG: amino acid adenylation domain-containing protein, partial [Bacteroidota bacterium]